jgi:hypothetical protein
VPWPGKTVQHVPAGPSLRLPRRRAVSGGSREDAANSQVSVVLEAWVAIDGGADIDSTSRTGCWSAAGGRSGGDHGAGRRHRDHPSRVGAARLVQATDEIDLRGPLR